MKAVYLMRARGAAHRVSMPRSDDNQDTGAAGVTQPAQTRQLGFAATQHTAPTRETPVIPRPAANPLLTPTSTPLLARIGRFTVLESLGEGGMGIVYAAYDDQLDRKVAVKVLRNDTTRRDPSAPDRM